jgi:MtfA peptidase
MPGWIDAIWPKVLRQKSSASAQVSDALWRESMAKHAFLASLDDKSQVRLRDISVLFLGQKEFCGVHGLQITDSMAMSIAVQACLPVLNMAPGQRALAWYDDFVGIVVHPAHMRALRETVDDAGVVHHYQEELAGEAMAGGPITLNWIDVANANSQASMGTNLVIHEFAHKLDMRSGEADGCPPLPKGFMGTAGDRAARQLWLTTLQAAYESFREQSIQADRFGQARPWLDGYAAHSLPEFFAVASEAYFVNRARFDVEFPTLTPLFNQFFDRRQNWDTSR